MRFYCDLPLHPGQTLQLPERARRHALVLRVRIGDHLTLFNGDGHDYVANVVTVDRHHVAVEVLDQAPNTRESPLQVHLALVMSKGERMDWALQKAIELGVSHITLLSSERCEVRLRDLSRQERKVEHAQQVLISAAEQCGRSQVPMLAVAQELTDFLVQSHPEHLCLVLDPLAKAGIADLPTHTTSVCLLIGPEGGLSPQEIALSKTHLFQGIRLGPRILRTETAPLVMLSLLQQRYGDF